jgi:hypothetical protein
MRPSRSLGRLYLNDQFVGNVVIRGYDGPWGFGEFWPEPVFERFAPLFNEWSRLMHAPEAAVRLTERISDALRRVECALYAIHAKIHIDSVDQWRQIAILNIDGKMIEWKEQYSPATSASPAPRPATDADNAGKVTS